MAGNCNNKTATNATNDVEAEFFTSRNLDELRQEIEKTGDEAKGAYAAAFAENRKPTPAEKSRYDELMLRAEGLSMRLAQQQRKAQRAAGAAEARSGAFSTTMEDVSALFTEDASYRPQGKAARGAAWGRAVVKECSDGYRFKGITSSGTVLVATPQPPAIIAGRPAAQLRSFIPTQQTDGVFSYLRQDVRINRAAPVAPGTLKPVSDYLFTRVDDRVRTIAHLSTPLHRADLSDASVLQELVSGELLHGLEMELERQIILGDGVGENFLGIKNTPGIQTTSRPTADDMGSFLALRQAVTRLEVVGLSGGVWICSPQDWENLETTVVTDGSLLMNAGNAQALPLDRSARRLYGIPVCSTPSAPPGFAYLIDPESTRLWMRQEARIDWSESLYDPNMLGVGQGSTLFETNQVRFRCENRSGFGVLRPTGIVRIDLS